MKSIYMLFALCLTISAFQAEASGFTCKRRGDTVYAVSNRTGQSTHSWSRDDGGNPMYQCQRFTGQAKSNYNRNNYYCKRMGDSVCAAHKRHGQCGHYFSRDDHSNPMYTCQRHLGQIPSSFNRNNYYCKRTPSGVCAAHKRHGQCGHTFSSDDHNNPMWACRGYLGRR